MNDEYGLLSLSTCTTPDHGLSKNTLESVYKYADDLPWIVDVGGKVDWANTHIGHYRLKALSGVTTDFVFCLDSDDELVNRFPRNPGSYSRYDAWIFQSIRPSGSLRAYIEGRGSTQAATQRVVFRTSFLKNILDDLINNENYIREDVYMMYRALEHGNVCYIPYPILHRTGPSRCSKHPKFVERHELEKKEWERIFTESKKMEYTNLLKRNTMDIDGFELSTRGETKIKISSNIKDKLAKLRENMRSPAVSSRRNEEPEMENSGNGGVNSTTIVSERERVPVDDYTNTVVHVCIPIIFPNNDFNEELLYALRSWDKYFHHGKYDMTVIGNWKPDWLDENEVEFMYYADDPTLRRAQNQAAKIEILLDRYESIVWSNDDIYLLKSINYEHVTENWYNSDMNDVDRPYQYKLTPWGRQLWSTYDRAKELNHRGWDCELHIPYYYRKFEFIDTQRNYSIMDGIHLARSAYMNQLTHESDDVRMKKFGDVAGLAGGKVNFNSVYEKSVSYMFHDDTILANPANKDKLINFLKIEFPDKCRFEKGGGYFWQK